VDQIHAPVRMVNKNAIPCEMALIPLRGSEEPLRFAAIRINFKDAPLKKPPPWHSQLASHACTLPTKILLKHLRAHRKPPARSGRRVHGEQRLERRKLALSWHRIGPSLF